MKIKLSNGVEYEVNSTSAGNKLSAEGALRRSLVVNYELTHIAVNADLKFLL
jgi:hypothetical protein